jgi:diguanylate cyclase (GGDEF)-like protein
VQPATAVIDRLLLATVERRMSPLGAFGVLGASLLGVAILGLVDWATGPELSFSIFYVLPVSAATWFAGMGAGVATALVSAGTWLWADLAAGAEYSSDLIPFWNTLVRLGYFVIISRLLALLKQRLALEAKLAGTDVLTGLPNSRGFREALATEHARAMRYRHPFTVVYLDLDDFKGVNDSLGHAAGDRLLRDVALALRGGVRRTDVVGRLGGDEFAALLPETDGRGAAPVLTKIRDAVLDAMRDGGWSVGTSVGAITFTEPPATADEALGAADNLMYEAKRSGKNRVIHRLAADRDGPGYSRGQGR